MSEHRTNPLSGHCDKPTRWGWRDPIFCKREAIKEEEGHHWCAQHAPSAVKARADAKEQKWQAQRQRWKNDSDLATAKIRLIDAAIAWAQSHDGDLADALDRRVEELQKVRGY